MKASVLIYGKLNFVSVVYMPKGVQKTLFKKGSLVNHQASRKSNRRQQILFGKKMSKNDKYLKKEDHLNVPNKFRYILVYFDVYYVILITGCFNYLQLCHFFHLLWFFLKIAFFTMPAIIS